MPLSRFTDEQLGYLMVSEGGTRGYSVTAMGVAMELSPKGREEMRRIWDEEPDRRPLFGEYPPSHWRSQCP